jgi:hypothetical protein
MAVRLLDLRAGSITPKKNLLVFIYAKGSVNPKAKVLMEELDKFNDLIGTRTFALKACSVTPQQSTLPRGHCLLLLLFYNV